ncbi:MAG: DUF2807 domain-containing protein [Spirosomataceae bacterium]
MKKTISINISGAVFYIEEDGYDKLSNYLAAIQQYFSRYEGSQEIIADIEGRIAEKFADKLQKEEKQAISLEDVEQLIASMGTVADFEALEEQEDLMTDSGQTTSVITNEAPKTEQGSSSTNSTTNSSSASAQPRKLYRDTKRRLLGGVCAGVAHYFNTDPLWVRLIFLAFFFGWFIFPAFAPFLTVLYFACWVAFPPNANLEEDDKLKKLYRDREHKVVGGVVAGISAYTGWDLGMLRLVFALSIVFFGTGLILYLILWAITPEAKTLTDKMQMTGEPITLENIETNIKRATNVVDNKPEGTITKILLLPFRAIAALFGALGPFVGFLVAAARIFAGLVMVFIAATALFALLIAVGVSLGILSNLDNAVIDDIPVALLARDVQPAMFIMAFMALAAPFIAIGITGVSLVAKRSLFSPAVWQSLLGLFLAGLIGSSILIPRYVNNFSRRNDYETTKTFTIDGKMPLLVLDDEGGNHNFHDTHIRLEGYDSTGLKLVQTFIARGKDRQEAQSNARSITYNIEQKDSVLTFDRNFEFKEGALFRAQRLNMTLYMPFEKNFVMTRRMAEFITNELDWDRIDWKEKEGQEWGSATARFQFTKNGDLVCLDERPESEIQKETFEQENNDDEDYGESMGQGEYQQTFDRKDFSKVDIAGAFYVEIRKGSTYKVILDGDREDVEKMEVDKKGDKLVISHRAKFRLWSKQDRVNVRIEMPDLEGVEFSGATKAIVKGFDQNKDINIEVSGASQATFSALNAATLDVEVSGASKLTLLGKAANLKADLTGASTLKAFDLKAEKADVDASGASTAKVNSQKSLRATASGASNVYYRGNQGLQVDSSGSVNQDDSDQE